tara:strand:+ start:154 stop:456 length:303 start_codon:yes stop_codon:yes gene_type:complete
MENEIPVSSPDCVKFWCKSKNSIVRADRGDFIVRDASGSLTVMKPEGFHACYEAITEPKKQDKEGEVVTKKRGRPKKENVTPGHSGNNSKPYKSSDQKGG